VIKPWGGSASPLYAGVLMNTQKYINFHDRPFSFYKDLSVSSGKVSWDGYRSASFKSPRIELRRYLKSGVQTKRLSVSYISLGSYERYAPNREYVVSTTTIKYHAIIALSAIKRYKLPFSV